MANGSTTLTTKDVLSTLKQLLPKGSFDPSEIEIEGEETDEAKGEQDPEVNEPFWDLCPGWAPDVFAVAATLAEQSGCFTQARCIDGTEVGHRLYMAAVRNAADEWERQTFLPQAMQDWWDLLIAQGQTMLADVESNPDLVGAILKLLATSDEVCAGIGWAKEESSAAQRARPAFLRVPPGDAALSGFLPYGPHSLCRLVPPDVAIVLPKAMTPSVGCSLRAMSHHLSLLPSRLTVLPTWHLNEKGNQGDQLRLLVIPFPFTVARTSFERGTQFDAFPSSGGKSQGYFGVKQEWLNGVTAVEFVEELILPLLQTAERESGEGAHGILFPECAFSKEFSDQVAKVLAKQDRKYELKFMIAGVMDPTEKRNKALCYTFDDDGQEQAPEQSQEFVALGSHSKHHPWCLDVSQIRRYGLPKLFQSTTDRWWEEIDVSQRQLPFFAIRDDLCMTVLICEDLARADPAMSVIRAVGPNLVVALLMDGPQLAARWPGRYATVLADDPGSSVLSITCAGMVDRSNANQKNPVRAIGLWRHANGDMQELVLPAASAGLLLYLQSVSEQQFSLDHRGDGSRTSRLELQYVAPLGLGGGLPNWARGTGRKEGDK